MASDPSRILRCAIYTRKSTEHGLELEFNSLDAQREACESYIKSQASTGWRLLPTRYDDPAFSGGNMDRPALKALLSDIDAGRVDVVVVYKIDRLTRSLADFAKLVEIFDRKSVSFVAVTQQFNTTTSMGRLTLNVLLSFAQFERELSSERVRDKVAASRRKGKWTGGGVPLGYDARDKKLVVNIEEAETVRFIFCHYLRLGSMQRLIEELDRRGIVTKARKVRSRVSGGIPFGYGSLAHLLKNRIYLGETGHNGKWFEGEHEPILDRETFEAIQALLKSNAVDRKTRRSASGAPLAGLLHDDRGNRMSPSYSVKNGVRYRFYVSAALLRGRKAEAGTVSRVGAQAIEAAVFDALDENSRVTNCSDIARLTMLEDVSRVVVGLGRLEIVRRQDTFAVPWNQASRAPLASVEQPPMGNAIVDPVLIQAVVRAHHWVALLLDGTHSSIEALAKEVGIHPKVLRKSIRLAYLSPDLTTQILDGTQSPRMDLQALHKNVKLDWFSTEI